jgi:hypothetical protein
MDSLAKGDPIEETLSKSPYKKGVSVVGKCYVDGDAKLRRRGRVGTLGFK